MSDGRGYVIPSAVGITPAMGEAISRGAAAQTKQAMRFKEVQMDTMRRQQTAAEMQIMINQRQGTQRQQFQNRQLDAQISQNQATLGIRKSELDARLMTLQSSMDWRELQEEEFRDRMGARKEARVYRVQRDNVVDQQKRTARFAGLQKNPQVRRAGPAEAAPVGYHREEFAGVPDTFPLMVPDQFKEVVGERQAEGRRERHLRFNVSKWDRRILVDRKERSRLIGQYNKIATDLAGVDRQLFPERVKPLQRLLAAKKTEIDTVQTRIGGNEEELRAAEDAISRYMKGVLNEPERAEPVLIEGPAAVAPAPIAPPAEVAPTPEEQRRTEMGEVFGETQAPAAPPSEPGREWLHKAFEEGPVTPEQRAERQTRYRPWYEEAMPELTTLMNQARTLAQTANNAKILALLKQLNNDIAQGATHPDEIKLAAGLLRDFINLQGQR